MHSTPCNAALLRLVWTVRVTVVSTFSLDWAGAVANNFVITVVLHAPGFLPWFVPYPAFVFHLPFSFYFVSARRLLLSSATGLALLQNV